MLINWWRLEKDETCSILVLKELVIPVAKARQTPLKQQEQPQAVYNGVLNCAVQTQLLLEFRMRKIDEAPGGQELNRSD